MPYLLSRTFSREVPDQVSDPVTQPCSGGIPSWSFHSRQNAVPNRIETGHKTIPSQHSSIHDMIWGCAKTAQATSQHSLVPNHTVAFQVHLTVTFSVLSSGSLPRENDTNARPAQCSWLVPMFRKGIFRQDGPACMPVHNRPLPLHLLVS